MKYVRLGIYLNNIFFQVFRYMFIMFRSILTLLNEAYICIHSLTLSEENGIIAIVSRQGFLITKESSKLIYITFFIYLTIK